MKVAFQGTRLTTSLKVSSTIGEWSKDYVNVEIDTGAWKTAIPESDIIPDPHFPKPMLKWDGMQRTKGLGFDGFLNIYEANLLVGAEDEFKKTTVLGTIDFSTQEGTQTMMQPVLGREIIHKYKWKIDHRSTSVEATKY